MQKSREILKKIWGYDAFRPLQEDIVDAAIYGKDVLALLPTGGGKSVCFQVPGMAREGLCVVISPLIALMEDQVRQLSKRGVRARALTSGLKPRVVPGGSPSVLASGSILTTGARRTSPTSLPTICSRASSR